MHKNNINKTFNSGILSKLLLLICSFTSFTGLAVTNELTESSTSFSPLVTEKIYTTSYFSLIGKPKYSEDFEYFDYVNPQAPKGGTIRLAEIGSYDNFNLLASRGVAERSSGNLYETLFTNSADELDSYYPLIATTVTYSDQYQWAEVTLNPKAHFSDGIPITAQDVEFSFTKMMTEGVPQYRVYYKGYSVKALDLHRVRFQLPKSDREKLFSFIGNFRVIPQHFWQNKNLAEPLATPPIGSGAYLITDYQLGQYVVYELNPNYWGNDLPVNRGINNFQTKRIDYYADDDVALVAFKAGEYDFRSESQPKNWFSQYQGQYFDNHYIIKQQDAVTKAIMSRWLAFNLEKPLFKDIKVRQALTLAFDFVWLNHAYYYDNYIQPMSFFAFTPYAAQGKPNERERQFLLPYAEILPANVFGNAYSINPSNGDGFNRDNLLTAKKLLQQAGWIIKDNQLVNQLTGQPFEFELLTFMGADNKYAIPFQKNLAKLGIKMNINSVDYAQMTRRLRKRDFDMIPTSYIRVDYPTSTLMILWGSNYLNSSWNSSGLHNQAIDDLIAQIPNYIDDEKQLIDLGRSLDRVLTHFYPMIPMWTPRYISYAYWNKFAKPKIKPIYQIGLDTWWYDAELVAKLPKNNQ